MRMKLMPLAVVLAALAAGSPGWAQSPDLVHENRDMVRVMRNPDGSKSVYQRQSGMRGMRCSMYSPTGRLVAINDYQEGRYGQLASCIVYDANREPIYKVSYGYDSQARLIEERMYAHPEQKLVQRVIYRYDANGERSKPLIVSLNTVSKVAVVPTLNEEVEKTHKELRNRKASSRPTPRRR